MGQVCNRKFMECVVALKYLRYPSYHMCVYKNHIYVYIYCIFIHIILCTYIIYIYIIKMHYTGSLWRQSIQGCSTIGGNDSLKHPHASEASDLSSGATPWAAEYNEAWKCGNKNSFKWPDDLFPWPAGKWSFKPPGFHYSCASASPRTY